MSDALTREWQSLVALALGKLVPKKNPTKMPINITETLEGLLFTAAVRLQDDAAKIRQDDEKAAGEAPESRAMTVPCDGKYRIMGDGAPRVQGDLMHLKAGDTIERVWPDPTSEVEVAG